MRKHRNRDHDEPVGPDTTALAVIAQIEQDGYQRSATVDSVWEFTAPEHIVHIHIAVHGGRIRIARMINGPKGREVVWQAFMHGAPTSLVLATIAVAQF